MKWVPQEETGRGCSAIGSQLTTWYKTKGRDIIVCLFFLLAVTFIVCWNVGHFGLGRFGPDISATDISATENAKGGSFGHSHKLWVGVSACINVWCISQEITV